MISDAIEPLSATLTPSESTDTTSDDDDAVNTSDARVYFGPVLSPEKRLAPHSDSRLRTPIRRSSRLSTAPRHPAARMSSPLLTLNTAQASSSMNQPQGASSEAVFLEEPSSALATKVMSACDNPSPPPSPQIPSQRPEALADLDPSHFGEDLHDQQPDSATSESAVAAMLDADSDAVQSLRLPDILPIRPSAVPRSDSPADLITFDHAFQQDLLHAQSCPADAPESTTDDHEIPSTIDDLLSISPQPHVSTPLSTPPSMIAVVQDELSSDPHDSQALTLSSESPAIIEDSTISKPSPVAVLFDAMQPVINFTFASESEGITTPLRRSSRPRRSVSPLVTPLVFQRSSRATEGEDAPMLPLVPSDSLLLSPRSGPARSKSWQAQEVAQASNESTSTSKELGIPRRSEAAEKDLPSPRGRTGQTAAESSQQRLRSLSPTSSGVLAQLLPSKNTDSLPELQRNPFIPQPVFALPPPINLPPFSSTLPPPRPEAAPLEPPRTPARRVPITQAAKEGSLPAYSAFHFLSPRKPDLNVTGAEPIGSPVFRKVALDDPKRSPAKRIPITEATPSIPGARTASNNAVFPPLRPPLFPRSRSEEPQVALASKGKRSVSVEPLPSTATAKESLLKHVPSSLLATPSKASGLPFPIPRTPKTNIATIPEGDEFDPTSSQRATATGSSSPTRSTISKQPSERLESRIPRIGAKPYARPTPKLSSVRSIGRNTSSSASRSAASKAPGEVLSPPKPRVVRRATGKPIPSINNALAGPGPRTQVQRATAAATITTSTASTSSSTLKRKRDEESRTSPTEVLPKVMIRKVTSTAAKHGTLDSSMPASHKNSEKAKSPLPSSVPNAAPIQGKIKMRKVVTVKPPDPTPTPPTTLQDNSQHQTSLVFHPHLEAEVAVLLPPSSVPELQTAPSVPSVSMVSPNSPTAISPVPGKDEADQPLLAVPQTQADESSPDSSVRRTPRRKAHTDVLGTIAAPSSKLKRHRPPPPTADFGAFAGMSALALKSLTASNTIRNQQQVVELHREIVRMEIRRPDSPTTKVRTMLERQKEEKAQARQLRAERRAQRASGEVEVDDTPLASSDVEVEEETRDEDSAIMSKHRRGPGEVEDYATPPRAERPLKRGRFEGDEEHVTDKRVTWDRGLSSTVFLDGSPPKPTRVSQQAVTKGCLTLSAKTLRLDTMGNVLNASTPLTDLVHENIIVKKFVYLDDPEPEPPADPAVRATRSKSKKAKS